MKFTINTTSGNLSTTACIELDGSVETSRELQILGDVVQATACQALDNLIAMHEIDDLDGDSLGGSFNGVRN